MSEQAAQGQHPVMLAARVTEQPAQEHQHVQPATRIPATNACLMQQLKMDILATLHKLRLWRPRIIHVQPV